MSNFVYGKLGVTAILNMIYVFILMKTSTTSEFERLAHLYKSGAIY